MLVGLTGACIGTTYALKDIVCALSGLPVGGGWPCEPPPKHWHGGISIFCNILGFLFFLRFYIDCVNSCFLVSERTFFNNVMNFVLVQKIVFFLLCLYYKPSVLLFLWFMKINFAPTYHQFTNQLISLVMERYRDDWGCWWKQYVDYLSTLPSPAYQPQILFRVPLNPQRFSNSISNTGIL